MGKRLVVCIDGTWNGTDVEAEDTNVLRFARAVPAAAEDGTPQIVLYLRGVGTAGLVSERLVEGVVGLGVDDLIKAAYLFLAQNHVEGDDIYVIGFSRGAFAARSLVGMIAACGLLRRGNLGKVSEAWKYYGSNKPHDPATFARKCKAQTRADVSIRMLGVWDTVGALGVPGTLLARANARRFSFHDTNPSCIVQVARQALAIDEHRKSFVPTLWTGETPPGCSIKQVWFAGAHADIGGGYAERALADIPLLWMVREADAAGLNFDADCLPKDADPLGTMHNSSAGAFVLSRLRPIWREIDGRQIAVGAFERLYRPVDLNGHPLPTINEAVHTSVFERLHREVTIASTSVPRSRKTISYVPLTIKPWANQYSQQAQGFVIER